MLREDTALVVLSGGQDSTTCLYWAKQEFAYVHALTFHYGQRHSAEVLAAKKIAQLAQVVSHEVLYLMAEGIDIPEADLIKSQHHNKILKSTSPLVSDNQLEQYKDHQSLPGGLEKTFVPGRNALFFVLAANRAYDLRAKTIVTGICEEDFGGYPDCREDFRTAIQHALSCGFDAYFRLVAPLMFLTKAESVRMAVQLPGCMAALEHSHTSYDGAFPPTGKDHATLLRAKGFEEAGVPDPLVMRAIREGLMEVPPSPNYDIVRQFGTAVELYR